MACIYVLRNKINGKLYVGQSVNSATRRFQSHRSTLKRLQNSGEKRGRNWSRLYCAMDKYGVENFEIIEELECSIEDMDTLEIAKIIELNTITSGYNVATGGSGGKVKFRSDEFKAKVSAGLREAWASGKFANKKTVEFTQEIREKISAAAKGKPKSEETKQKMSESAKLFGEQRSALMSGENNPNFGKKRPDNVRQAIRLAQSNPIVVEDISYRSQKEAAEYHGVQQSKIKAYVDGKIPKISVEYEGVKYRSVEYMAKELGIHVKSAYKLLKELPK